MAVSTNNNRILKPFDGKNFSDSKLRMELLLDEQNVLQCIKEINPDNAKWIKLEKKCKSLITQYLDDAYLEYVRENEYSRDIWNALINNYEKKGPCSKRILLKHIMELKYDEKKSLETHFLTFSNIMRQLKNVGAKFDESDFCCMLLNTLPSSYESVVTAIETFHEKTLNLEDVKRRLIEYEVKLKSTAVSSGIKQQKFENKNHINQNQHAFTASKNFIRISQKKTQQHKNIDIKCDFCGRKNHMKKDCFIS